MKNVPDTHYIVASVPGPNAPANAEPTRCVFTIHEVGLVADMEKRLRDNGRIVTVTPTTEPYR